MIKVAIVDNNEAYLKRLHNYLSKTYGSSSLVVYVYSTVEQVLEQLKCERIDILVVNSQMEIDWELVPQRVLKLYLLPGKQNGEINQIPALAKNGNADEFYQHMMELYEAHMNIERETLPGQMVLFTSATGGCGTSSVAVGYGKYLAAIGKRVLYISLEAICAVDLMTDGQSGKGMEDLFYLCETNRKNLSYSIENVISTDSSGLFFVAPCKNPIEMQEKDKDAVLSLLRYVTEKGNFDVVIVDRELSVDDMGAALMKQANGIVLVAQNDIGGRCKLEKTRQLFEELNHRNVPNASKLRIIYNKALGVEEPRENILGSIPLMTGYSSKEVTEQISKWQPFENVLLD